MSFAAKLALSRNELLWLVTAKEGGRKCWYYVLVDKPKHELFKAQLRTNLIHVADYGTILYSGWGEEPPEEIKLKIKEQFG